ncbi:MAG: amino acid ABC transporter substrate-binding protein [Candidatus Staskawiczbacteria bacterium]|nr:amino acid ABC transporter substrate-binding protein [Candidatus Staskawiczbacteria bacterium]
MNNIQANWLKIVGIIVLVILIAFVTVKFTSRSQNQKGSVYTGVVNSGTIRSCYSVYPPYLIKDPNTGKLSGIFYDIVNKASENMGLQVDWNAEISFGELVEALNSNRCDIVGSGIWPNSARGKSADFTVPVFYAPLHAYVRANDFRFDNNYRIANDSKYTISTIDGETAQIVAKNQFPNAKTVQLPQLTDVSQMLLNVADGKADMTFAEPAFANLYIKNNPGKIKSVSASKPVVAYGSTIILKKGEVELRSSLDTALTELLNNGYIDQLLDNYEKEYPSGILRVGAPYAIPAK